MDDWLDLKRAQGRLTDQTKRNQRVWLVDFAMSVGADRAPCDIGPMDFARWVAGLQRKRDGQPMRPGSIVTVTRPVRAYFAWAVQTGLAAADPTLDTPPPRVRATEPKALSREQVARLLSAAPDHQWRAMIVLIVCLGLRTGDVAAMQIQHWRRAESELLLPASKGAEEWLVATNGEADEALAAWVDHGLGGATMGPMWPSSRRPGNYSRSWIGANIKRIGRRAGVDLHAHMLRHTTATEMERAGVTPAVGMRIMRHRSMSSYQVYSRASLAETRAVLAERPRFRRPA
jgi:site-specific recombinase XerD